MRLVGIDPGAHTGMVCIDVPESLEISRATWIGSAVVRPAMRVNNTDAENDLVLFERVRQQLDQWNPIGWVVMEEPVDARPYWRGQKDIKGHATGTLFALGRAYGLALAAARPLDGSPARVVSYPVTNSHGRQGWMRGMKRAPMLELIRGMLRAIKAPVNELSEHEMMGFGLCWRQTEVLVEARFDEKVARIRKGGRS